ncbi:MAG: CRISPR-associated endonuclease Cas6/Csy4 [Candidatus Celerinatantimonas neptuna]|nr:MAG: CRISPR-associated endonuclease Cas6/Csy4 [Candidatus Celerinatantimonas neptuna]
MDHYLEIQLLPDPEFSVLLLMNALFSKLHRALVATSQGDIGVSFPHLSAQQTGDVLRIHGQQTALQRLEQLHWRQGLGEFTQVSGIKPVPAAGQHCLVSRVQTQSNADRLRRRAMKRQGCSYDKACQQIPNHVEQRLHLPSIQLKSHSTGQRFRLFIRQTPCEAMTSQLLFSKYGLSQATTVPWF